MFHGSMVALVTAMASDGALDHERLARLIEFHLANGTHTLLVGEAGPEGSCLSPPQVRKPVGFMQFRF